MENLARGMTPAPHPSLAASAPQEVRALARTMKHTQVYGLRTKGTRNEVQGALAAMEAGGEDVGVMVPPSLPARSPDEVSSRRGSAEKGLSPDGPVARDTGGLR